MLTENGQSDQVPLPYTIPLVGLDDVPAGPAEACLPRKVSPVLVAGSVAFAIAVVAMMQTISIPLLPALGDAFDTSLASVSWVATSTLIVGAAFNPIAGRMGDMYGKRRLMLGSLGAAIVGTVVAATAGSLPLIVAGRAIQGVGSAVVPLSYGIIRDALPGRHLSRATAAVTAAGAGVGAGFGPVIMGAVIAGHGWRTAFWLTGALLLVAMALLVACTSRTGPRFPARFDAVGAVVLAVALVVLLLAITNGAASGWTSITVLAPAAGAVLLVAWWLRWERSRDEPIVDLVLNRRRPVLLAHLGGIMIGCATFTQYITSFTLVTMPADTGLGLGRSLTVAGLIQLPGAVVITVAVAVATRLSTSHGARPLLWMSAGVLVAGFAIAFARHGSVTDVVISTAVVSLGIGVGQCAVPLLLYEHVVPAQTSAVNAVSALARVVGSVLASALVTSVMATGAVLVGGAEYPAEWTFLVSYAIGAAPAVLIAGLALAVNSS